MTSQRKVTVADAMVRAPKTHPVDSSVDDLRCLFTDDHVHAALLVSDGQLAAVCERPDLPDGLGNEPALRFGRLSGRVVAPGTALDVVARYMIATQRRRLAVVEPSHRLLGLLCLKRSGSGFCSDIDVLNRAADRVSGAPNCDSGLRGSGGGPIYDQFVLGAGQTAAVGLTLRRPKVPRSMRVTAATHSSRLPD